MGIVEDFVQKHDPSTLPRPEVITAEALKKTGLSVEEYRTAYVRAQQQAISPTPILGQLSHATTQRPSTYAESFTTAASFRAVTEPQGVWLEGHLIKHMALHGITITGNDLSAMIEGVKVHEEKASLLKNSEEPGTNSDEEMRTLTEQEDTQTMVEQDIQPTRNLGQNIGFSGLFFTQK